MPAISAAQAAMGRPDTRYVRAVGPCHDRPARYGLATTGLTLGEDSVMYRSRRSRVAPCGSESGILLAVGGRSASPPGAHRAGSPVFVAVAGVDRYIRPLSRSGRASSRQV